MMTSCICINSTLSPNFTTHGSALSCSHLLLPSHNPDVCTALISVGSQSLWPWQAGISLSSAPAGGHVGQVGVAQSQHVGAVALTVYCGNISGWFGCLVRKIHQPASSALASLNRVLICQSVGFLHMNSSIFVSGKIAFVFLCLLIHPCRPLSLALCMLLVQFRNGIQGVIRWR